MAHWHQTPPKRIKKEYRLLWIHICIPNHTRSCQHLWSLGLFCLVWCLVLFRSHAFSSTKNHPKYSKLALEGKNHRIFNSTIVASFHADVMCFTMIHLNRGPPVETILFSNPLPSLFPSETNIFNGKRRATTTAPHGGSRGAGDRARSLPLAPRASHEPGWGLGIISGTEIENFGSI